MMIAAQNPRRWSSVQAVLLHIPAAALQNGVARCSQTGEVRHLRARHERKASVGRKAQDFLDPLPDHFFDHSRRWSGPVEHGVLVPHRCEPVRRNRGRQPPANYPAEESPSRRPHDRSFHIAGEFGDDYLRRTRFIAKRPAQAASQACQVDGLRHRFATELVEKRHRQLKSSLQREMATHFAHEVFTLLSRGRWVYPHSAVKFPLSHSLLPHVRRHGHSANTFQTECRARTNPTGKSNVGNRPPGVRRRGLLWRFSGGLLAKGQYLQWPDLARGAFSAGRTV